MLTRRECLAALGAAVTPAAPVAIARCAAYDAKVTPTLDAMFGQLGGLERMVRGKTVTVKLNLTGSPGLRVQGRLPGVTHYVHPQVAGALAHLMGRAGARRIRFVESGWALAGPLEEYLLDAGWNVRALVGAAPHVEFENTNNLGQAKRYVRLAVPGGGYTFPSYELNHAYEETDVFVSLAKLKNHGTCGVTLSLKNCFGITPASIYGDDARPDGPNENPSKGRLHVLHEGRRQPAPPAAPERDAKSSRAPGYRVPRIVADLAAARPIQLAVIDGIVSIAGGEGPWIGGVRLVEPGVLIAGTNPVCTDAVAAAVMGYDPRASPGQHPFRNCDNTLLLAEAHGVGTADLHRIEVRGEPISRVLYKYGL